MCADYSGWTEMLVRGRSMVLNVSLVNMRSYSCHRHAAPCHRNSSIKTPTAVHSKWPAFSYIPLKIQPWLPPSSQPFPRSFYPTARIESRWAGSSSLSPWGEYTLLPRPSHQSPCSSGKLKRAIRDIIFLKTRFTMISRRAWPADPDHRLELQPSRRWQEQMANRTQRLNG
jgi:hypothetical protein